MLPISEEELVNNFNDLVKNAATFKIRKICGLEFWQKEKLKYSVYDNEETNFRYKTDDKTKEWISKINDLFKNGSLHNKDDVGETILPDHFIYQLVNITTNEPISIRKIMQLALNIGQWIGSEKTIDGHKSADEIFKQYDLANFKAYLLRNS